MVRVGTFLRCAAAAAILLPTATAVPTNSNTISSPGSGSLDEYIASERSLALQAVLDNIGPDGATAKEYGAASGLVIASKDYYSLSWTRDSALTMKTLVDLFIAGENSLKTTIENYIVAQGKLQTVSNLSGNLSTGGLGEALFTANGTAFDDFWVKRPERDGPAVRATALIAYARHLVSNGQKETANTIGWPIISNDLSYIGQYWNQTGFDIWENTNSSSFFTLNAQHRALTEGRTLATQLGQDCKACTVAPQLLCLLQSFWNGQHITANLNIQPSTADARNRTAKDASTILSSIQAFDPSATSCDPTTLQPCSDHALANHKAVIDTFRPLYRINSGIPPSRAVAVGRYPEDRYMQGNPWFLLTTAAAEQLYGALLQWAAIGCIDVTPVSLPFWQALDSSFAVGTYASTSSEFGDLTAAVKAYADGFLAVVQKYTPPDGALSEQFSRDTGMNTNSTGGQLSVRDLTWSYSAFLSAVERRKGVVPGSWGVSGAVAEVPRVCSARTVEGVYVTPTNLAFPA